MIIRVIIINKFGWNKITYRFAENTTYLYFSKNFEDIERTLGH